MRDPLRGGDRAIAEAAPARFVPCERRFQWRCKSVFDRVASLALLLLLSPLLLLVAILVRASSPGPIFYRRRVLGLDGVQFDAFKFRTMVVDAEARLSADPELRRRYGAKAKLRDDPRLAPCGSWLRRTSIDELPQLFNVLRGDMSLVGPRMFAPDELADFDRGICERLRIKPGMTGLWQVSGRQELSYEDRVRLDLRYIHGWSLWLDLVILLRTVPAVFTMRGAY